MSPLSRGARFFLACRLAVILLLSAAGIALADDPPSGDSPPDPSPAPAPVTNVTNNTYNTFQFPILGDVLKAVFGGINEETKKAAQPGFDALNFTLKTPSLSSDGQSIGGQLNFNAIVEPMWWAVLPVAGVLGFILLLLSGIQMQAGAVSGQARSVGQGMQEVVSVIVGLALAFFSLQLVHYANEGTNLLVDAIMGAGGPDSGKGLSLAAMAINMIDRVGEISVLASIIVALILLIGALVLVAMAVARWALFFICVVLSPLALVSMGSRVTGALTSLWGQLFMLVLLLGPANAIMLRSAQGLYAVAIDGSAFGLNSMAKGAVMFGLISMMGAINGMAIQRAFGVAMGWAKAGVGAITSGALLATGGAAAVMAGGGLSALTTSLKGAGGMGLSQRLNGPGACNTALASPSAGSAGQVLPTPGDIGAQAATAGAGTGSPEESNTEESAGWGERFMQRRQGFDWGRASMVGGAVAGMAGGPVGRVGMAVQRLGMASTVEKRYREGRADRDQGRAESVAWREENRQRADLRDLSYQRQGIFGHPSGPDEVEMANAMDRAVRNVYGNSSGDVEGITRGLLGLGKEASAQGGMAGSLYLQLGTMSSESNIAREEATEGFVGARLETELASRGSLTGPRRYAAAQEGPTTEGPASQHESGVLPQDSVTSKVHEGGGWNEFAGVPCGPFQGAPGGVKDQQPTQEVSHENLNLAGWSMKGSDETKTGNQPVPQVEPPEPVQSASSSGASLASIEDKDVFDQKMARTMGSYLGVYDGQDWAGPTLEVRQQTGNQMLEEATRLRETDHLVEGLAMAIEIGKDQPIEPEEAMSRFRSGVDSFGPGPQAGATPAAASPGHGIPSDASGNLPKTSPQPIFDKTLSADEQESSMLPDTEQGSQLELEGWEMADPDNLEG